MNSQEFKNEFAQESHPIAHSVLIPNPLDQAKVNSQAKQAKLLSEPLESNDQESANCRTCGVPQWPSVPAQLHSQQGRQQPVQPPHFPAHGLLQPVPPLPQLLLPDHRLSPIHPRVPSGLPHHLHDPHRNHPDSLLHQGVLGRSAAEAKRRNVQLRKVHV